MAKKDSVTEQEDKTVVAQDFAPEGVDVKKLRGQVEVEYKAAKDVLDIKIAEWLRRLKLYNNQRRDQSAVGDPLLFTVFQTVLASLYDDKLAVEWEAREEGDQDVAENLNHLSTYDFDLMRMSEINYDWDWDTCFFGRGIVNLSTFDRDKNKMCPLPEVIDPTTFLRDPRASSINGNVLGRNAARFLGREIQINKYELEDNPNYFNVKELKFTKSPPDSLKGQARQERDAAQGRQHELEVEEDVKGNETYDLVEWYTFFEGKRVLCTWGNDKSVLVRYQELESDEWPLIDRTLYPISHDWDGVSIPDLIEDKQRARSVMLNLGIKSAKADLYPMYIYDENRIKNRANLNFAFNKMIPVKGDTTTAVYPMNKVNPNLALYDMVMQSLDVGGQRATATPEMQQGAMSEEQRTLGELNLIASKVDARYSLSAKIFGWSEKAFWRQWYFLYKKHFKSKIDEKVVRIGGAFGSKWRTLTRENVISKVDPDARIESKVLSEAKKMRKQQMLGDYMNIVMEDPDANRRYGVKKLGKLAGLEKDELERLLPPTPDELVAEEQNKMLSEDEDVEVLETDNHIVHLEIHAKAAATDSTYAHVEAHKEAIRLKQEQPELFPEEQAAEEEGLLPQQQPGVEGLLPQEGGEMQAERPQNIPSPQAQVPAGAEAAPVVANVSAEE